MKRVLCAWLPHWPLQRWRTAPESHRDASARQGEGAEAAGAPLVLLHDSRPPRPAQIVAASSAAVAAGVRPGMALVEALALTAGADGRGFPQLVLHDPEADRQALVELAQECHRFSPAVSLEDDPHPASLLLEVGGTAARLGGESALTAEVLRFFSERGFLLRVAIADTLAAARAVARWGTTKSQPATIVPPGRTAEALASLPIAALRLPDEMLATLDALGLRTIQQVERLPRAALPSRGGQLLLERLDQAHGRAGELASRVALPERWIERRELEFAVERSDLLAAVAEQLLRKLTEPLRRQGLGWWQLKCVLAGEYGSPRVVGLTLFRPSASARYLRELLELRWERLRLAQPITSVEIQGLRSGPLLIRQNRWLADDVRDDALGELIDRLVSRLGPAAVWTPRRTPEAQPELAYRAQAIGPEPPVSKRRKKRAADPLPEPEIVERPLQLLRRPRPLEVIAVHPDGPLTSFTLEGRTYQVAQCDGPERIETGWWRGPPVRRDYFHVETTTGQRAWVFRREDDWKWLLHGW